MTREQRLIQRARAERDIWELCAMAAIREFAAGRDPDPTHAETLRQWVFRHA